MEQVESKGLRRELRSVEPQPGPYLRHEDKQYLHFSGNDYFGLRADPRVTAAAAEAAARYGAGSGASRLVTGNHPCYEKLESSLATYKQRESALVFGSGYLANIGTIAALVDEKDLIIADKLVHACMLDGAILSGAELKRFAHNDVSHLAKLLDEHRGKYRHCLLLTESIFSMDGDRAPLLAIAALAKAHDSWLMVDDAHGLGFVDTIPADIVSGTLSKGLGSYGGYVAASKALTDYLTTHARSLVFSTALPPASVAAATEALQILTSEPERSARVSGYGNRLTSEWGGPCMEGPIVPLVLGSNAAALEASERLKEKGIWITAIRPPTVPQGTARLRITFSASHTQEQVDRLISALQPLRAGV